MEVLLAALLARQVSGDAAGKSMDWAVNFEIYYCVTHCRGGRTHCDDTAEWKSLIFSRLHSIVALADLDYVVRVQVHRPDKESGSCFYY